MYPNGWYDIGDIVKLFHGGVSRQYIWKLCKNDEIPSIRLGTKYFVDAQWVEEKVKETEAKRHN